MSYGLILLCMVTICIGETFKHGRTAAIADLQTNLDH